jgi:hypothetical protein
LGIQCLLAWFLHPLLIALILDLGLVDFETTQILRDLRATEVEVLEDIVVKIVHLVVDLQGWNIINITVI